ncbi:hypothetical protein [Haloprofundus salilacus]|uniref:hypothetical protein n=1 Tax=Haloprofundus salilacus TaxID=2876190 RepID=UPI001CCF6540|nr:hypothetical protein [Haloprofundus salilacus]
MRRRSLLSALPAVLAGCTVRGTQLGNNVTRDDAEDGCPGFHDRTDELVCAGTSVEGIEFAASGDLLSLDENRAGLEFELMNRSEQPFSCNPYAWAVYRKNGLLWKHVVPDAVLLPLLTVGPGDSLRWRLRNASDETGDTDSDETDDGSRGTGVPDDEERVYPASADLKPGTYAFSFSGNLGESPMARHLSSNGTEPESERDAPPRTRVECVATFVAE